MEKAYVILSGGQVFEGLSFGSNRGAEGIGALHAGSVGYMDAMTNEENDGKVLLCTFPMIGNYGVIKEEINPGFKISGMIVHEWCAQPSNFKSVGDIDSFCKENAIAGVCGVDTREMSKILRSLKDKTIKITRDTANMEGEK